jgi:hypothetical protein
MHGVRIIKSGTSYRLEHLSDSVGMVMLLYCLGVLYKAKMNVFK